MKICPNCKKTRKVNPIIIWVSHDGAKVRIRNKAVCKKCEEKIEREIFK